MIELESSTGALTVEMACTDPNATKLRKLIALSERMSADAALARQIRRKLG